MVARVAVFAEMNLAPRISVHNRQRKIAVNLGALERFARRALQLVGCEKKARLTSVSRIDVVLISDRRMSELHQRFMGIAGPTDVITFQHGEVFISVETARRQAKSYGTRLAHELRLYLVHGLLHLHGYDDREPKARAWMAAAQEKIMRRLVAEAACDAEENA